ncbi:MAG: serine/threonine-protein kinase [Myxococcales bacterium]|nr:serine/threonine protein kinase [Myxococcota bacterium]MDW8281736.1 serine/threonine-protein kinase [Myxococcales bacterium]
MAGCLAENTLVEFVEGRLNAEAMASLHRHVDVCSACRALLREVSEAFLHGPPGPADRESPSLPGVAEAAAPSSVSAREGGQRPRRKVALRPGDRVGQYRILRQVGIGGMGVVFEAVHEQLRRRVAIKVLYPHYADNPQMMTRLLNEARAANMVRHPAIVSSFEVGHLPTGEAYLVMEYLDGEPLRLRLKRLGGRLGPGTLRILRQVASAVSVAHSWGVIHRDLKPANVMLVPDPDMVGGERVRILDFGLAKLRAEFQQEAEEPSTQSGVILGTPAYMAPEQCQEAATVDEKADVYSLGVMIYECTSGRLPFVAKGAVDLMAMHIYVPAPPLSQLAPEAPPALVELVGRMLCKSPADRPTMAEVAAALDQLESPGEPALGPVSMQVPILPAQRGPWRGLLLAGGALLLVGLVLGRAHRLADPRVPAGTGQRAQRGAQPFGEAPMAAGVQQAGPAPSEGQRTPAPPSPSAEPAQPPPLAPARRAARRQEPARARRSAASQATTEEWTDERIRIFR